MSPEVGAPRPRRRPAARGRHAGVRLHAAVTVSNHFHLLVSDATSALSGFMRDFETAVAKSLNELRDREGHVFDRRYSAEPVLDTAAAIGRVLYTVLNPPTQR